MPVPCLRNRRLEIRAAPVILHGAPFATSWPPRRAPADSGPQLPDRPLFHRTKAHHNILWHGDYVAPVTVLLRLLQSIAPRPSLYPSRSAWASASMQIPHPQSVRGLCAIPCPRLLSEPAGKLIFGMGLSPTACERYGRGGEFLIGFWGVGQASWKTRNTDGG